MAGVVAISRLSAITTPMNTMIKALALCCLATAPAWGQVPTQTPLVSPNARPDPHLRDATFADQFIPVITMEQIFSGATQLQGYRVQIFKDGQTIYHGLKNVKTLGEVRFDIKPDQVQRIESEFRKYKFWSVPEDQYGMPKGFGVLALQFNLRDGDRSKTVRFAGQPHGSMLQQVIEAEVKTASLRCPFQDDDGRDPCPRRDEYIGSTAQYFLKYDFPTLLETYK